MKEEIIRILMCEIAENPKEIKILNTLAAMQEKTKGYIETLRLDEETVLICNEEGKLLGLQANRPVPGVNDLICGPFFIARAGVDDEDFTSLTDEQLYKWAQRLSFPQVVQIQYKSRTPGNAEYVGNQYSYFADVQLCVGDIVTVPTKYGASEARVARINVPLSEVSAYIGYMRHITKPPLRHGAASGASKPAATDDEQSKQLFFGKGGVINAG